MVVSTGSNDFPCNSVGFVTFQTPAYDDAVRWLTQHVFPKHIPVNIRLANAYNVALAERDPTYRALLHNSGVNFPDGKPVVWVLRRKASARRAQQVRGPSLFLDALAAGRETNVRHFLLGGSDETLTKLKSKLQETLPGVIITGAYAPPFAAADREFVDDCAAHIRASEPDVVWVGLGTPKQDVVGTALARQLVLPTVNVGAAFDFASGQVREAPKWLQGSGFEWLFRLMSEPRRLWRRYLIGNVIFIWAAIRPRKTR